MIFIHIQGFGSVSGRIRCFCLDPDPVFFPESRFDFQISPDPVYPERLDPDPVNIRPDPKPYPCSSQEKVDICIDKQAAGDSINSIALSLV